MTRIFKKGQKVRENRKGAPVWTVTRQHETTVWVLELNSPVHATKIIAVK